MCDHEDREASMTVIARNGLGVPTIWCDPCLEPIVRALNAADLPTIASCCGHGHRPGHITLASGHRLTISDEAWSEMFDEVIHGAVGCTK